MSGWGWELSRWVGLDEWVGGELSRWMVLMSGPTHLTPTHPPTRTYPPT